MQLALELTEGTTAKSRDEEARPVERLVMRGPNQKPRKRRMTTDQWVSKLNAVAREMDAICQSSHPATWDAQTAELREKYRSLAKAELSA